MTFTPLWISAIFNCTWYYYSFDCNPPVHVRAVFLDTSKAFDKVEHDGLIHKIKCTEINGMLLELRKTFLENRFQRVFLNGKTSSWEPVLAVVPQGSVLGPLFSLIYINDLSQNLPSNTKLFADGTSVFSSVKNIKLASSVENV